MTRTRSLRGEEGFTLIEVLVAILIIGILAAIAIPAYLGHRSRGFRRRGEDQRSQQITYVESCHADTLDYADCTTTEALVSPRSRL